MNKHSHVIVDPWRHLRQFTSARIALGRSGSSLPTQELLDFELMRGRARDAVYCAFSTDEIARELADFGFSSIRVHSAARDRTEYLQRPDLGRRLSEESRNRVEAVEGRPAPDLVFVIADGLSSAAPMLHALPVLRATVDRLAGDRLAGDRLAGWSIASVVIAEQARVALGDEIGERMRAGMLVIFIGERPGLSSPDSLGIYITFQPQIGATDAQRNCISNVRQGGMSYELAADKLHRLIVAARSFGATGVALKDLSGSMIPPALPSSFVES